MLAAQKCIPRARISVNASASKQAPAPVHTTRRTVFAGLLASGLCALTTPASAQPVPVTITPTERSGTTAAYPMYQHAAVQQVPVVTNGSSTAAAQLIFVAKGRGGKGRNNSGGGTGSKTGRKGRA